MPVTGADSVTLSTIASWGTELCDESLSLACRYRALFALKHHACLQPPTANTQPAIESMAAAFSTPSALLKHEVAYCLGQTRNLQCAQYLRAVLNDRAEDPMCRHEAAEALGALGDEGSMSLLKERRDDENERKVVRETCEIAVERIEWEVSEERKAEKLRQSDFSSIDPAPPTAQTESAHDIDQLGEILRDASVPLFKRYRAMFALRDLASPPDLPTAVPAVNALASGFADNSALFRHEIAFVFGQLSHPASIAALTSVLANLEEDSMVRHEAAEALGSMGEEPGIEELLRRFVNDKEKVVAESVQVALDMVDFERSGQLSYATLPAGTANTHAVAASA